MKNALMLYCAGLLLVCAEIFLPGIVAGTLGVICILGAIVLCYATEGAQTGSWFLLFSGVSTGLGLWLTVKIFRKSSLGKSFTLESDQTGYKASTMDASRLLNKSGTALSFLRPSGIAMIDDQRLDVLTEGEFIEQGTKIRVIKIEGNRIIVARVY